MLLLKQTTKLESTGAAEITANNQATNLIITGGASFEADMHVYHPK